MTSKEAGDHLVVALGRMDALLVRLEAAVGAIERAGLASGAPVDPEEMARIDKIIARLKVERADAVPIAD